MPQCSWAQNFPVAPPPVWTSSTWKAQPCWGRQGEEINMRESDRRQETEGGGGRTERKVRGREGRIHFATHHVFETYFSKIHQKLDCSSGTRGEPPSEQSDSTDPGALLGGEIQVSQQQKQLQFELKVHLNLNLND